MSITIWQTEIDAQLSIPGTPYYIAEQRATDYYRQFTKRENTDLQDLSDVLYDAIIAKSGTPDVLILGESNFLDANLSPESRTLFNDLVRQLLFNFVKEFETDHKDIRPGFALKFVSRLIRMSRLDEILNNNLREKIQESLGDENPWKIYKLAEVVGFEVRDGSRTTLEFDCQYEKISKELRIFTKTMI